MEKSPKAAFWRRADLQVHAVVFVMLSAGMLSAAINGGWSVVLRRPEAYVLLVVCAALLAEVVCRRRLNFDPPCRLNSDPGMEAGSVVAGCA